MFSVSFRRTLFALMIFIGILVQTNSSFAG